MAAEQTAWTAADTIAILLFINIWFVVSFYFHLPVLTNQDYKEKDLHGLAAWIMFPTILLTALKKFCKETAYYGYSESSETEE